MAELVKTLPTLNVMVDPLPSVSITLSALAICDNGDITLTVTDLSASGHTFSITADLVDDNGTSPLSYTGVPTGTVVTYTEGVDFEGSLGNMFPNCGTV